MNERRFSVVNLQCMEPFKSHTIVEGGAMNRIVVLHLGGSSERLGCVVGRVQADEEVER
jgi:hypothetical protein